ncbi:MAG: hypothetical protein KZQ64_03640 [gamma proteobacterium symbiont of Bathyaustriella thionipta]|nr:hypothetical protein [gamma proteobacterium symbiont of Bathyaustriella thionipta]MCU7948478.1 hypothetical protein [gamma proteobacterium symbiont of Bathyaustriella thionipta]MCU7952474.1 hypothetical protein [gamma proteobacterium symbiont of Bathyaustriella thionipta]MCU7956797.1 hypothetical protein [gamma proteobacterium symbiont of Bathyaustriella thionipta]MCU7967499.1 hypothetical protein [gamma proteobacterium symbiont of Bathyaustriella thionipta]
MKYLALLTYLILPISVPAQIIYKCTNSDNSISFQGDPCTLKQSSKRIDIEVGPAHTGTPWYKNRGSAHTVGSADPVYRQNKKVNKVVKKKNDNTCQHYKDRLNDAQEIRWDIKKRRYYSRSQKDIYERRISDAKNDVAKHCHAQSRGLSSN